MATIGLAAMVLVWRMVWHDDSNQSNDFEGSYSDGAMRFTGWELDSGGRRILASNVLQDVSPGIIRHIKHLGVARMGIMAAGGLLLLGYAWSLNLAPLEFRHVVGLDIATVFVVWQIVNAVISRTYPTVPIAVGGLLIVTGGVIVTFWSPAKA